MQHDYLIGNKGMHCYNGNIVCPHCQRSFTTDHRFTVHKCPYCATCHKKFSSFQWYKRHTCTATPDNIPRVPPEHCTATPDNVPRVPPVHCTATPDNVPRVPPVHCTATPDNVPRVPPVHCTATPDNVPRVPPVHCTATPDNVPAVPPVHCTATSDNVPRVPPVHSQLNDKNPHQCVFCNITYSTQYSLKRHKCTYCKNCKQKFRSFPLLMKHSCFKTESTVKLPSLSPQRTSANTNCQPSQKDNMPAIANKLKHSEKMQSETKHKKLNSQSPQSHDDVICVPSKDNPNTKCQLSEQDKLNTKCKPSQKHNMPAIPNKFEHSEKIKSKTKRTNSQSPHSDHDVICMGMDIIGSILFQPVDVQWQIEKCIVLDKTFHIDINIDIAYEHIQAVPLDNPSQIYSVKRDGNCFFRCISFFLTGSEDYHVKLRQILIHHMCSNPLVMKKVLPENTTMSAYITRSHMLTDSVWVTHVEIFAMAHMLHTDIYTYTQSTTGMKWLKYSGAYVDSQLTVSRMSLYIDHNGGDHYNVVTSVQASINAVNVHSTSENILMYREIVHQATLTRRQQLSTADFDNTSENSKRQSRARAKRSESKRAVDRAKDAFRKSTARQQKSQSDKQQDRAKDADRQLRARDQRSQSEKQQDRAKDADRQHRGRDQRSQSEKQQDRAKDADRQHRGRDQRSQSEKQQDRAKDADRQHRGRDQRSQSEKQQYRAKHADRQHTARDQRSQSEKQQDRAKDADRQHRARDQRCQSEKQQYRAKHADRQHTARDQRCQSEKQQYRAKDADRQHRARDQRCQSEKQQYRAKDADRQHRARDQRCQSEKQQDRAKDVDRKTRARHWKPHALKQLKKTTDATRECLVRQQRLQTNINLEKAKDAARKCKLRRLKSEEKHVSEKKKDKARKERQRKPADSMEKAINTFKVEIQNGPTYICTCCNRLLFKSTVSRYNDNNYTKTNKELLNQCRTSKLSADNIEYICSMCKRSLQRCNMPKLAVANGLEVDDVPQQLQDLTSLESMFIARRIPFMKLLALPRGKQKAIHGCVVNIPVDPEQSVAVLPRIPSSDAVITVKLKRKLQYRGHVIMQNIRPFKIKQALHVLKYGIKNPHYEDVIINDEWEDNSLDAVPDVWSALTQDTETHETDEADALTDNIDHNTDQPEDEDQNSNDSTVDNTSEDLYVEDERSKLSGLPYDSCMQPKDITADNNMLLNIAPGEGKRPQPFHTDEHAEELSFPQLFPTGRFGFSMKRQQKLTQKKYFQSRILHCDGRFAKNLEYIFYAQYRSESKDIADCLSISLRKGKQQHITASQLKDKVSDFIRSDLGIHFLQKVRGSPAYFNKMLYDLLGMIRQLGACTWFITLSAADLKWTDTIRVIACQRGQILGDEEIHNLSWEERCTWLRSNPVTAARHFDHRVQLVLKHVLLNHHLKPLGKITDYKYRIEFQQRGSPHVHMLAWVEDAPNFETNSEDEIQAFVDKHITCSIPGDDEDLSNLLGHVQKHTHSVACRKHGKKCRFHFPRPPVRRTIAASPPAEPVPSHQQELYTDTLQAVQEQLEKLDINTNMSFDTLLAEANVSEETYIQALRWIKTKSGQPAILLERKPCEVSINSYNSVLMKAWEANIDAQFVTNVYQCVMYVASYVSKSEKTLGDVLKAVSESGQHLGPKQSMKHVAKKFLTHREISAQEAVYRLLSLPLTRGSRQVIFVPTDLPANRTRLFKPMKVIEALDDDDPDVFQTNILDRYQARPSVLEGLCLADFASTYAVTSKPQKDDIHPDLTDEEENAENTPLLKSMKLNNDLGHMVLRNTPAIIRSHQFSEAKDPEQYYHAQLILYHPWRDEVVDLCQSTYKTFYLANLPTVGENRARHQYHSDEVSAAVDDLAEYGAPEDAWADLAPQAEQARHDDTHEGAHPDPNSVLNAFDANQDRQAARDLGLIPHEYVHLTEQMTNAQWFQMILSLNPGQAQLHRFIVTWCTLMMLTHRSNTPDPFHIFLTGGAGSGKSHLVRTIVQTVTNLFSRNNQKGETHILVCAPTGAAAYNISGYTLHAAFLLPLTITKHDDYIHLSNEKLAGLKESIGNLKVLVIDEISMVGSDMLLTIHRRLCDIMGNDRPFGGISVLAVGDLLQLPPVGQRPVFSVPTDELAAIYGSLWQTHFELLELTEIVRQKNDCTFASLLNRVRTGEHTPADLDMLKTRQPTDSNTYPKETTHIFAYNKLVHAHNISILDSLQTHVFTFNAVDSRRDAQTGRVEVTSFSDMSGGLAKQLRVTIQARVMLTKNLDVSDGLVNSAAGVVTGFLPEPPEDEDRLDNYKPKYIMVQFNDERVGHKCRQLHKSLIRHQLSTPIPAAEAQVQLSRSSRVTAKRTQFPLTLAWAVTIHKEQGKTEDSLVISCEGSFQPGQFYTAISRTKTLEGLVILGDMGNGKKIKVNRKSLAEIERMKSQSPFKLRRPSTVASDEQFFFKMGFLNTNSLLPHADCVVSDDYLTSSHIICLAETWLTPADTNPDIPNHFHVRCDLTVKETEHRRGGLLMFIHFDFLLLKQLHVPNTNVHHLSVLISPRWNPDVRICVVCLYRNPTSTVKDFLPQLERLLIGLPLQAVPTFICGDFNIDLQSDKYGVKQLLHLMTYYGLRQYVEMPTHRRGGLLDHMYVNRPLADVQMDVNPVYYSDHLHVSTAVPFPNLHT